MQLEDLACDRQAKARSLLAGDRRGAKEPLADSRQLVCGDADALVGDLDDGLVALGLRAQDDRGVAAVLDGVGDQVGERLLDAAPVRQHLNATRDVQAQLDPALASVPNATRHNACQHRRHVEALALEHQASGLDHTTFGGYLVPANQLHEPLHPDIF